MHLYVDTRAQTKFSVCISSELPTPTLSKKYDKILLRAMEEMDNDTPTKR